jgi:hypothetical protein
MLNFKLIVIVSLFLACSIITKSGSISLNQFTMGTLKSKLNHHTLVSFHLNET